MSRDERLELAAAVDEIYSLIGWIIHAPTAPLSRSDLFGSSAPDHGVTDRQMRDLLVQAYDELDGTRVRLISFLSFKESIGETIDEGLTLAGLSGPSWQVKLRGWRQSIEPRRDSAGAGPRVKIALKWAKLILGSLSTVPIIGQLVEPLKGLEEAAEIQAEGDNLPPG